MSAIPWDLHAGPMSSMRRADQLVAMQSSQEGSARCRRHILGHRHCFWTEGLRERKITQFVEVGLGRHPKNARTKELIIGPQNPPCFPRRRSLARSEERRVGK